MSLSALLDLGDRELVALVGGGGKSTLMFALGEELAAAGKKVLLTTTTKLGRYQVDAVPTVCAAADPASITAALARTGPVMLAPGGDAHKVTGPAPEVVDQLFAAGPASHILVEADGSHGLPLKAPAAHEPVIPSATTLVVIVMGIDAIGRPLAAVTHRIAEGTRFSGREGDHIMTPADCVSVLLHPDGALRSRPPRARVVVALTKVATPGHHRAAAEVVALIAAANPEIITVIVPPD